MALTGCGGLPLSWWSSSGVPSTAIRAGGSTSTNLEIDRKAGGISQGERQANARLIHNNMFLQKTVAVFSLQSSS
jgi:hypothetical protein